MGHTRQGEEGKRLKGKGKRNKFNLSPFPLTPFPFPMPNAQQKKATLQGGEIQTFS
ncbi:hypothetical protein NIES25_10540 [Nostoc linckia NIES-25]|nr:hypothetical protein NIES25_10540 [Nostoc linckia NIES-25]